MYKDLFGNVRPPPRGGGREAASRARNNARRREKRRSDPDWRARENQRDREWRREKRRSDPEFRARENQRNRERRREKRRSDPEWRERENQQDRERRREKWRSDPEYRERVKQRNREWRRENREWRNAYERARLHRQGGHGYQKFRGQLVLRQNFRCANPNCTVNGGILTEETAHVDHIVPVSKWPLDENGERLPGLNDASNLQVMHAACNISKNATPMDKWARNDDA